MREPFTAPPGMPGWTHVWDYEDQLAISDDLAVCLCHLGVIRYSGDYRVYYPCGGWTCELIAAKFLVGS